MEPMGRQSKYSPEFKERAVRAGGRLAGDAAAVGASGRDRFGGPAGHHVHGEQVKALKREKEALEAIMIREGIPFDDPPLPPPRNEKEAIERGLDALARLQAIRGVLPEDHALERRALARLDELEGDKGL